MKRKYVVGLTIFMMGMGLSCFANQAVADTVKLQSQGKVKSDCAASGGTYFKFSKGEYGCLNSDTSGIACGGVGSYAKTCSTFRKVPPRLPTREEITKFEAAEATAKK